MSWAGAQLVEKFPALCRDHRLFLPWTRSVQFTTSHPISLRTNLILSSHLHTGLSTEIFAQASPPKPYMNFTFPHTCHIPSPSCFSWFDLPNNFCWGVQITRFLTQSHPVPCNSVWFRPKHFRQDPISEHPQRMFLPRSEFRTNVKKQAKF
jgi:hypothetical protein